MPAANNGGTQSVQSQFVAPTPATRAEIETEARPNLAREITGSEIDCKTQFLTDLVDFF